MAHHVDRAVGARVAAVGKQHHDASRVRTGGDRDEQPGCGLAQACGGRGAADVSSRSFWKSHDHARLQPHACKQQGAVGRDLVGVGGAASSGRAAGVRDTHRTDVEARGLFRGGSSQPSFRPGAGGSSAGAGGSGASGVSGVCAQRLPEGAAQQHGSGCRERKHESLLGGAPRQEFPPRRKPDCVEPAATDLSRCA